MNIIHNYEIPYEDSFPVTFQYVDSLPFVGIRRFETRSRDEGNSTPNWYVEIKKIEMLIFITHRGLNCQMMVNSSEKKNIKRANLEKF